MKFHDYHLSGYTVDCNSASITLKLSWPYDKDTPDESIVFTGVIGYQFSDALDSVLCNIREIDINEFITSKHQEDSVSYKALGIPKYWHHSAEETVKKLRGRGKRVWLISSAIGFEGHVICDQIHQPTTPHTP